MRKVISTSLVMIIIMILMVGCAKFNTSESSIESNSQEKILKVTTTYAGADTNARRFKESAKEWGKKNDCFVENNSATSDETFKSKILIDFETSSEPDVLFFFNGVDSNKFVEQGKVVSIDEIRKVYPDYASNMKQQLLGASPVDGKKYSVPVNGFWEGLYVNKEVCELAGIEVPSANTTWNEFMEMCEKLKNKGFIPIAISLNQIPHYLFEYAIYNFQDTSTHSTVPSSIGDVYAKAWVKGLQDIKRLYKKGYFPKNTLTISDEESFDLFTSDKAAFLIDGSWRTGGIESEVNDVQNFTVTYVPGRGKRRTTDMIGGLSMGYYITKKCWDDPDKRKLAVDFISYMTSNKKVAEFSGTSATALIKEPKINKSKLSNLEIDGMKLWAGATSASQAAQDSLTTSAKETIFTGMSDLVKGKISARKMVQKLLSINAVK